MTFETYFRVKRNVIYERARFNSRNQLEGEPVEQYVLSLHSLARNCEYGTLQEELIRDRIVIGIRDKALSRRLQLDADLTLEKAMRLVRQNEAVGEQQKVLQGNLEYKKESLVRQNETVGGQQKESAESVDLDKVGVSNEHRGGEKRKCSRCGREHGANGRCPAQNAVCFGCKRKGHFRSMCRSNSISEMTPDTEEAESCEGAVYLGTIEGERQPSWLVNICVGSSELTFKLDTGAEVTAISENAFRELKGVQYEAPAKKLYGPSHEPLSVVGQFIAEFKYKERFSKQTVFVVKGLKDNLLGLPAIRALNLIVRVNAVSGSTDVKTAIMEAYPTLFHGLGTLGDAYEIQLKENAKPFSLYTARSIPIPLRDRVKEELVRMVSIGVISQVDQPTPWCAGIVVAPKRNGDIRICVDLKALNESVLREVYPLPTVDETLAQLTGATVFSKLDANSGFWQIPLADSSRLLTTFITPFGRYCFNKLPFGISSAPELFQKRMGQILEGLDGVLCQMDDVLVFGSNQQEHDFRLHAVLKAIKAAGVTLNSEKCSFSVDKLKFLGHVISRDGVSADPDKTKAILQMKPPTNITELRRFMGMVNQLGKFSPNVAQISQPLRELLSTKSAWVWGTSQDHAFSSVKTELTRPTVLALYNPMAETLVSADASSNGLGAVLLQKFEAEWRPVVFASRSMSETETRYAQIEKEALAITWACDKFSIYILGRQFTVETDHKPLVPLLSSKQLDSLPPRILRFRLRLMRYHFNIKHVPGKLMYTADTLSRAPTSVPGTDCEVLQDDAELFAAQVIAHLPASKARMDVYRSSQTSDPVTSAVIKYCRFGWPEKHRLQSELRVYWSLRGELTVYDGLLFFGKRLVIPQALQEETRQSLHQGHQGIQRCQLRASSCVRWPGISKDLERFVKQCLVCAKRSVPRKEPMIPSELPKYPWQKVGTDHFEMKGATFLLVVDYFSSYVETTKLASTTSSVVITALKSIFARFGVPEIVVSDNGPQFVSKKMKEFSELYRFQHTTSSPHYPQSNGQAKRAVQTVKRLLSSGDDPYLTMLCYRATPLSWCGLSPAQLLMGRLIRTNIPQISEHLVPKWDFLGTLREKHQQYKVKMKCNYDESHRVQSRSEIPIGTDVWVSSGGNDHIRGKVTSSANTPRSYIVETPSGEVRRTQEHLVPVPEETHVGQKSIVVSQEEPAVDERSNYSTPSSPIASRTRLKTGVSIRPPQRL